MLTVKGLGGGSAKVTNGILQEMYAAEGEIPAGMFVDVKPILGSADKPGLKVKKIWNSWIEPEYKLKIQLSENRFLYAVDVNSDKMYKACVGRVNTDNSMTLAQSGITILDGNATFTKTDYVLGSIALDEMRVLVLTNGFKYPSDIYYQVFQIVDNTVSILTPVTKLLTTSNLGNGLGGGSLYQATDSKMVLLLEETDSKSTSGIVHQIYRITLAFNSSDNTISYSDWQHIKQTNSFPKYGGVALPEKKFALWYYNDTASSKKNVCTILDFGGNTAVTVNTYDDVKIDLLASDRCAIEIRQPSLKLYEISNGVLTLKNTILAVDYQVGDKNEIYPADRIGQLLRIDNNQILLLYMSQKARDNYNSENVYQGTSYIDVFFAAKIFGVTDYFFWKIYYLKTSLLTL